MTSPSVQLEQVLGERPNGDVDLRSFDQGMIESLGARIVGERYYINIDGVEPPPGDPGIPVHFMYPEDFYANFRFPSFVITRDDISIAAQRLHPFTQKYRAAPSSANYVPVQTAAGPRTIPDRMGLQEAGTPYDLTYTINIWNSLRGGPGRRSANQMLNHVLRIWPVYGQVYVRDSLGVQRSYEAFNEGIVNLDDVAGILERVIQFAVTIRVEAEYDLALPTVSPTVTQPPTISLNRKQP
jgi:hypothetical protein